MSYSSRGEKKCKCDHDDCGQEFYTAQQLEVHQRTHNNNKPFICPEVGCARSFTTAGNLKNHLRCHTGMYLWPFIGEFVAFCRSELQGNQSVYFGF